MAGKEGVMDEMARLVGYSEADEMGRRGQAFLQEMNRRGGTMELPVFAPPNTEEQKTSNAAVLVLVSMRFVEQADGERPARKDGNCERRQYIITEEGRERLVKLGR